jgi:hypothetical protein
MQRVNEFVFYELAIKIHSMVDLPSEPLKYSDTWTKFWAARQSINEIYNQRPLNFTTQAALRLYRAITAIVPEDWDEMMNTFAAKTADPEPAISPWQINEVREAAREFETVLRNECQLMDTYFISKKGVYSTKDLVENAHYQISESSRSHLSDQSKLDFDQAGKCIALDVPTAAAFHLLRGTEVLVREYYELIVPGPKQAPAKMRNWGVYKRCMNKGESCVSIKPRSPASKSSAAGVYASAIQDCGQNPPRKPSSIEFPICEKKEDWSTQSRKIAQLNAGRRRFIELTQPFAEPPLEDSLRILNSNRCLRFLNELARIDRHRRLHTLVAAISLERPLFEFPDGVQLHTLQVRPMSSLEGPVARFSLGGWQRGMKLNANPNADIDLGLEGLPARCHSNDTFPHRLKSIVQTVRIIVSLLEKNEWLPSSP